MGVVLAIPIKPARTIQEELRAFADSIDAGEVKAELLGIVVEHASGEVTTDFFGKPVTNAHGYGVLGLAARNFIKAD